MPPLPRSHFVTVTGRLMAGVGALAGPNMPGTAPRAPLLPLAKDNGWRHSSKDMGKLGLDYICLFVAG
jgi:hypothetical protein